MFWPKRVASPQPWDPSTRLLSWSKTDHWTIGNACEGTICTGRTGSGKTTGPGAAIATRFLQHGFGGLVVTCKKSDRADWERYARATRRESDLVIFDASGRYRFSFLDEELTRSGEGAGLTENIVALLCTALEIAERNGGGGGREDEGYWRRALRQLCRNLVELLVLAKGRVTVPDLYKLVVSAPTSRKQLDTPEWTRQSFCFQCLREADGASKTVRAARDLELVADYFMIEFPNLSEKTRSVIVSTFSSMVDVLNRSLLRDLFSSGTNIRPEDTLGGKIIVVDLPIKEFAEVGQIAAVLWKYCWQRAVERRNVTENPRPVFLLVDEFQNFAVQYDQQFQTTARSSRAATVYLTQNIPNILAAFGGPSAKALTDSILGNLATKVWTANSDPETNLWAATVIGRTRQFFFNASRPQEGYDLLRVAGITGSSPGSTGFSEHMEFDYDPARFASLRTGGPKNRWEVDAIVYQGGHRFAANGRNWLPTSFRQFI